MRAAIKSQDIEALHSVDCDYIPATVLVKGKRQKHCTKWTAITFQHQYL